MTLPAREAEEKMRRRPHRLRQISRCQPMVGLGDSLHEIFFDLVRIPVQVLGEIWEMIKRSSPNETNRYQSIPKL